MLTSKNIDQYTDTHINSKHFYWADYHAHSSYSSQILCAREPWHHAWFHRLVDGCVLASQMVNSELQTARHACGKHCAWCNCDATRIATDSDIARCMHVCVYVYVRVCGYYFVFTCVHFSFVLLCRPASLGKKISVETAVATAATKAAATVPFLASQAKTSATRRATLSFGWLAPASSISVSRILYGPTTAAPGEVPRSRCFALTLALALALALARVLSLSRLLSVLLSLALTRARVLSFPLSLTLIVLLSLYFFLLLSHHLSLSHAPVYLCLRLSVCLNVSVSTSVCLSMCEHPRMQQIAVTTPHLHGFDPSPPSLRPSYRMFLLFPCLASSGLLASMGLKMKWLLCHPVGND